MSKSKLIILLLIAVSMVFFARAVLSENGYKIQYVAQFSQDELSFGKSMGYDMVTLKNGDFFADLGKPMLPSKELKIALPAGMAVKSVQAVNTTEEEIPGEFNILPTQLPRKTDLSDKNIDFVKPDSQIYASSQPYPSKLVEFAYQTDLAGQGIAVIQVYPLQYVPSEKRLKLYTSISLVIECVGGYECGDYLSPNISEKNRKIYDQMVKDMVNNPEDVKLNTAFKMSTSLVLPAGHFDHVIITSSSYSSSFQPLVDWHNQKGVRDTVITTSWIYGNYAGADIEKIRAFVIDANSTWGTTYFLMGGENSTVPFCLRTYYSNEPNTPSDQYYSDYDDDWTHEVFVGRVSVGSIGEITTFVNKVLKYEKDPPRTDYPLDVLFIGMDDDADTQSELLKEYIASYIPPQFNITKVYDSDPTPPHNHRTDALTALNAGQNLVNHADHANWNVLGTGDFNHGWGINNSDVDALHNDNQLSVVVSLGCWPNAMDQSDCIAEHFVIYNPNQAGVAFTGNTRDGYYYPGQPLLLSHALDLQWWVGLFDSSAYNLGQALVFSKNHFPISNPSMDVKRHCVWTFSLLGEPEMPIWTDSLDSFAVTTPDTLAKGTSSFLVHVKDSKTDAPVESAYVCLWKVAEIYLTGYTNASGDIVFNPSACTEGTMNVTVTKHNYLPSQHGVVALVGYRRGDVDEDGKITASDVVYLINYLFVTGPAPVPCRQAGDANCDGSVAAGDVVYLINYLFIGGPPPGCP